jgi:glucose-6-phosphate 1-epimerase
VITFENCLHTYFTVDDIHGVSVAGLQGVEYLDALDGRARKTELTDAIQFGGEVDRLFVNTPHAVEIRDAALSRTIHVAKEGSLSTVVWNPWIAKAQAMADFGDDEYQRMVCVESGNCAENAIQLDVGQESRLKVILSSVSW